MLRANSAPSIPHRSRWYKLVVSRVPGTRAQNPNELDQASSNTVDCRPVLTFAIVSWTLKICMEYHQGVTRKCRLLETNRKYCMKKESLGMLRSFLGDGRINENWILIVALKSHENMYVRRNILALYVESQI